MIHAPGYFLYNLTGLVLSRLLHVSAAAALQILNVGFIVLGVATFFQFVSRRTTIAAPFWLGFAYTAAAGMILAGQYLTKWSPERQRSAYAAAVCTSILFMILARPSDGHGSRTQAVAGAYFLKYSLPGLKGQKDPRLASLLDACGDKSVLGIGK